MIINHFIYFATPQNATTRENVPRISLYFSAWSGQQPHVVNPTNFRKFRSAIFKIRASERDFAGNGMPAWHKMKVKARARVSRISPAVQALTFRWSTAIGATAFLAARTASWNIASVFKNEGVKTERSVPPTIPRPCLTFYSLWLIYGSEQVGRIAYVYHFAAVILNIAL